MAAKRKKKSKQEPKPLRVELEAKVGGLEVLVDELAGSGTGSAKLDCVRAVADGYTAQLDGARDGKLSEEAAAEARAAGIDEGIEAGIAFGWSQTTVNKANKVEQPEEE